MLDAYTSSATPGQSSLDDELVPAPHIRRLLAILVDVVLLSFGLGTVEAVMEIISPGSSDLISGEATTTLLVGVYFILTSGLAGATFGKWLVGLRIVGPAGLPLRRLSGLFRGVIRYLVQTILGAVAGLTWWTAIGRRDHRAIHDLASDTRLVLAPRSGLERMIRPPLRLFLKMTRHG